MSRPLEEIRAEITAAYHQLDVSLERLLAEENEAELALKTEAQKSKEHLQEQALKNIEVQMKIAYQATKKAMEIANDAGVAFRYGGCGLEGGTFFGKDHLNEKQWEGWRSSTAVCENNMDWATGIFWPKYTEE